MSKQRIIIHCVILFLLLLMNLLSVQYLWIVEYRYDMKPKVYDYYTITNYEEISMCRYDAQIKVDVLFNTKHTLSFVKNFEESDTLGTSNLITRKIKIRNDLKIQYFVTTYAHELAHIKYQTANETYVNYISIITLYESGDEQLRQIAMNKAQLIIDGHYDGTEYDCGYYLIEYFKTKGVI